MRHSVIVPPLSSRPPDTVFSDQPPVGTDPRYSPGSLGSLFFLLLAAKVRSSCEEGPGQSALQSAYHDPQFGRN